jgi:hypothetical protein
MLTYHGTYLIRCWKHGKETCRVEVVHVQTGERALLHSTSAALAWIDSRDGGDDAVERPSAAR